MIEFTYDGVSMKVGNDSATCRYRVDTFDTKEPDTVAWLSELNSDCILWDIGANIGLYSIYAGLRGCRVHAFEPVYHNYNELNKNIFYNDLSERVTGYCFGLSNRNEVTHIDVGAHESGSSYHGLYGNGEFKQGISTFTGDELLNWCDAPTHIKIDVDGLEHLIVEGMPSVLQHPKLKSICIEIDLTDTKHMEAVQRIVSQGFDYDIEVVKNGLRRRKGSNFEGMAEFILSR